MSTPVNILVVEPSEIIREGLTALLTDEGYHFLAPLRDAGDLLQRLPALQPDIVVLNPTALPLPQRMPLLQIQQVRPQMAVVGLVYQYVEPELLQGFKTVIDIRDNASRVIQTLRECCQTDSEAADESYELSDRETEVLLLVAQGCSSKDIADRLCISIHTVNTHRKNITRKTGIKSVAGLAVYAMIHGLIKN